MKRVVIFAAALALSACGIHKTAEDTLGEVRRSNGTQDNLLERMKHTEAETVRLRELTSQLVQGMQTTNAAVHLQTLTLAMQMMRSPENTGSLTPPSLIMAPAVVFTREATSHEILETFHTLIADVVHGGTTAAEAPTANDLRIHGRRVSLTVASAIAAFTPEEKFSEILTGQVDNAGRFEETAYVFALCRYNFTRDFLFNSVVVNSQYVNLDSLRTAAGYYRTLVNIQALPYANKLVLRVPQFVQQTADDGTTSFGDLEVKLRPEELRTLANTATRRFRRDLRPDVLSGAEATQLFQVFAH